jgi:predicted metal-dependent phosphoesterase TrpH
VRNTGVSFHDFNHLEPREGCVDGRADLHLHTIHSDGALTPRELLVKAKNAGLGIISITDHDSVNAVVDAVQVGKDLAVEVVPGMELSASYRNGEIHILGYFFDYTNKALLEALTIFREKRKQRIERIVSKLNQLNIPLKLESVWANATGDSIGRPHVANAMVNEGHASSYSQAFNKYLGDGRPAYEKKDGFSPEETIELIRQAGGLSFLAHPGNSIDDNFITRLIDSGLDGIEVVHPSHSPELVQYYRSIVDQYYLLECGGSDFHGGLKNDDHSLGNVTIPTSTVDAMRRRLFS